MKNKVYILNPHYHLKDDKHRVVLVSRGTDGKDCSPNWQSFIHPVQAVLLSFFTHYRPYRHTLARLCSYFSYSEDEMDGMVRKFMENPEPVYVCLAGGKANFPKRLLVDAETWQGEISLDGQRPEDFLQGRRIDLCTPRLYAGPILLTLMLNNRCMTHCRYCYADTQTRVQRPLSTERILELIKEAADIGVQRIAMIGGEVFLHQDWATILDALVSRGIAPEYISTKLPLTREVISQLEDIHYQGLVQVSLDTCDEKVAGRLLGVKEGYVEKVMQGLKLLEESTLNYRVASVITTYNCDIVSLTRLYERLSVLKRMRDWGLVPVHHSISKGYRAIADLKPCKEQVAAAFDGLKEVVAQSPFPVIMNRQAIELRYRYASVGKCPFEGSKCTALRTHLFILPDGKVTVCEQLYWNPRFIVGDVTTESIREVWNSEKAMRLWQLDKEEMSSDSPCKECPVMEVCYSERNRCWADVIKAYGEEGWDYPDPRCERAPELKNRLNYDS